ncbi:MAG: fumarylacetoacetate hydrolase family protein [Bacteroidetes bacterium]|nr:fumarylacetoacetate hydrolase family protein [Bacteroidota bacterium]MDA0943463.1 fumarylacetoacetate hydrolase family protein [Bacteroidota bacterium]MDA1111991.1 fumarylacetoacetate hydrolase family protein [Bacteroidota bacterium]
MNLEQLWALRLDQAADQAQATAQLSLESAFDLDQAYEIQRLNIEERKRRGFPLVGLKMGFTSEAKMKQMGVNDLIWGRLTDDMVLGSGETLALETFIHPRVEIEVAFRIAKTIDRELQPEECMECVDGVCAALEIIDSRYENFKFSLEDVVADNCSSAAYVLGDWMPVSENLNGLNMALYADGELLEKGSSDDILGNPWKSLAAATRLAFKYKETLQPGMVVLAGAATAAHFLKPGMQIKGVVDQLGVCGFQVA